MLREYVIQVRVQVDTPCLIPRSRVEDVMQMKLVGVPLILWCMEQRSPDAGEMALGCKVVVVEEREISGD